ncbi:tRNA preQ1(34) S-adenosylmethionine ribosyltransferase-isomerase QueA [Pontiella sulfatireligans]|uniref:S-adenosylmethionine:tRNA ribosyltransferase-isomerase n=1 Tax=Pontiella sulfatireligans TaxID=2750658 RepID=A0A6C2UJ07_9BACT|nr:tRNA preQ1(34) S-adenosylmethionine ribosyltransferase-isomerase QueA [Pontiella sulfatireligans]VGO20088.1 S-adenosylmethionine:tRNA ribosyltransferase-isomerase [Pontiella sulfatireligans]
MKTDLFNYDLPPELIAQHPPERRELARMMVLHRDSGLIEHKTISDIIDYLYAPDVLVLNNTKVIPARVFGHKSASGGKVELLLLEEVTEPEGCSHELLEKSASLSQSALSSRSTHHTQTWKVLMKTSRRPKVGDELTLCSGKAKATMLYDGEQGEAVLKIDSDRPLMEILDEEGVPPLPPYISRKEQTAEQIDEDKKRYQTVYASEPGAAAAPTAGLHFTSGIFQTLENQGVSKAELTLHVGLGTFRPVSAEIITDHKMHYERYAVSEEAAKTISNAKQAGGRVVAVGSTSVRTLESLPSIEKDEGSTNIFIYPPYEFQNVDAILTNFHLPKSTLLMMMSAFAGRELMLKAYKTAVQEKYRFFSYGDCMLIL